MLDNRVGDQSEDMERQERRRSECEGEIRRSECTEDEEEREEEDGGFSDDVLDFEAALTLANDMESLEATIKLVFGVLENRHETLKADLIMQKKRAMVEAEKLAKASEIPRSTKV